MGTATEGKVGLQFTLGGEFGDRPNLDLYCRKVLGALSDLEQYSPLAMVTSLDTVSQGVISRITVCVEGKDRTASILPDLGSFRDYCLDKGNKIGGMIIVVPNLNPGEISWQAQGVLKHFFESIGKVANPDKYRIWFVDQDCADLLTDPKTEADQKRLKNKKAMVQNMGLYGVNYRHNQDEQIGWFEARPAQKPKRAEHDYSNNERVRFLKRWMEMVVEYRGGRIISEKELQNKLQHSKSGFLTDVAKVIDGNGIISQESCGCLVHMSLYGEEEDVLKCDGENCFRNREREDLKPSFRLGTSYPITNCGDCGGERTIKPTWVKINAFDSKNGVPVSCQVTCLGNDRHSKPYVLWRDPAKIENPLYLFRGTFPQKDTKKAA